MRTGSILLLWLDGGFRVMVVGMMLYIAAEYELILIHHIITLH